MTAGDESTLRIAVALGMLALMALWELAAPMRRADMPRVIRWSNNLALVALDGALLRLVFPLTLAAFATWIGTKGWGLFALTNLPLWVEGLAAILILDLAIWAQHRAFHHIPLLWRLHRMHHTDTDFDVTTGLRFHPVEILASMAIKLAMVAVLGPPALAVLIFELLLNASSLFNHANIRLPARIDRALRLVLVTPDMHRVHHSTIREETDSNFGFTLPWWDRLFGTYRAQPAKGHLDMTIGLTSFRDPRELWLDRLVTQPLRNPED